MSQIITKTQAAAKVGGVNYLTGKPTNPCVGDVYIDPTTYMGFIWTGHSWAQFSGDALSSTEKPLVPSYDDLEKHPSLKQAWEEYLVVKKLLGV